MTADDIAFLAQLLRRRSGMLLGQPRPEHIESRLGPVMRRFGFRDMAALIAELRHGRDALARAVTEAMTTNETSFFRDRAHFELFRETLLPGLIERRTATRRLRIWCAACAAGQEAYSIAMILDDFKLAAKGWSVDLIATDINSDMIARAEQGLYSHFEVQRGLPIRRLVDHFLQEGSSWRVGENLRRMVTFRPFNLLDSFGWLDDIDVVFCRNVLMYLDHKAKLGVLDKMSEVLSADGYLLLGPVETALGLTSDFEPAFDAPGVYGKARHAMLRAASG
ncbi:MAG TPA: protein-glutamate O-methyltransferase CheR [Rhizomicrobium sp.]|nr:protein-glutamate O-methyltransferase CheR [Rhizomicrobium sp.]